MQILTIFIGIAQKIETSNNNNVSDVNPADAIASSNQQINNILADSSITAQEKAIAIAEVQQASQDISGEATSGVTIQSLNSLDATVAVNNEETISTTTTANDPTFTLDLNNNVPVAENDVVYLNNLNPITISSLAYDSDSDNDNLTITQVWSVKENGNIIEAENVVINPDNTLTYTPKANFDGEEQFTYVITDGKNDYANAQVTILGQPELTDVHRFFQYEKGFHLYTTDNNEISSVRQRSDAGELAYSYEAEKFTVLNSNLDTLTGNIIEGSKPVYRFFNTSTGSHLYTMDEVERASIAQNLSNYSFEGIKYYAFTEERADLNTIPVFRMYSSLSDSHLFTVDINEKDSILENLPHYNLEGNNGISFHVFKL